MSARFEKRTVREIREVRDLTIKELAQKAGVNFDTILEIEHGRRHPRPSTRRKLADALGVKSAHIDWPAGPEFRRGRYPL